MVSEHLVVLPQFDIHRGNWQHLDGITGLKIPLAEAEIGGHIGELPQRSYVVDKGIIERFGSFVGEWGYILHSATEYSRRGPARILENPARLWDGIEPGDVRMEPKHAAASRLSLSVDGKQEGVGE